MDLRFRGADSQNGLTMEETAFYLAQTGTRTWVHIGCVPCYWDSLPEDSNEYSSPALRSVYTDWEAKISHEFDEWRQLTNHYDMEEFLEKHGYPKEKWMKGRITRAVTRFQAIWRGHLYKKAYPVALRQQRVTHREKTRNCRRNEFLSQNSIGAHMEILFDENHPSVALYSGEVTKIQGLPEIDGLYFWVQYHHDDEVRRYHWKKLKHLKLQCEAFKSKHGIQAQITGKLPLYKFLYP